MLMSKQRGVSEPLSQHGQALTCRLLAQPVHTWPHTSALALPPSPCLALRHRLSLPGRLTLPRHLALK